MMKNTCTWPGNDSLMIKYHDEEWGLPVFDDRKLFEYIVLDTFQAGLSWKTILHKRENFRQAFDNFDFVKISGYRSDKVSELLENPGIIRNKAKISGTISNAIAFLRIREEFGSFSDYLWQFVDNKPIINVWKSTSEIPASSELSDKLSKDLKKRGFKFAGTTICYAFLQACGVINDHLAGCFRWYEVQKKEVSG